MKDKKQKTGKIEEVEIDNKMTSEQELHLQRIKDNFLIKIDSKYRNGQRKHGGDLMCDNALSVIDKAIEEALDLYVYLETVRETIVGR